MDFSIVNGFFTTVQYAQELEDNSWLSKCEAVADVCRSPSRWLMNELWKGGKRHVITLYQEENLLTHKLDHQVIEQKNLQGTQRMIRLIMGVVFSLPGQFLAIPFMTIAYFSEEIRLKHKIIKQNFTDEDKKRLSDLIQQRQELAKERQGCEPISCVLCSICCLLCCLVLKK